jgi:type II secretory pathway pseudopilin PulG
MSHSARRKPEQGTILIVLMIGVAIASIALTAVAQIWSTTWRRDSEEELIFRGKQYGQAILAYQKEHGGQYPINLEDLFKPGPRRLRYVRKLFKDPIAKDGKWGLVYLAPGGQSIYDPGAAARAQKQTPKDGWDDAADAAGGSAQPGTATGTTLPGFSPIGNDPARAGVPNNAGPMAGALPPGVGAPPPLGSYKDGVDDEKRVSEPPIGWPIIGVVSRASGKLNDMTFGVYKGHDKVDDWQFLAWDLGGGPPPVPGGPAPFAPANQGIGPGNNGKGAFSGIGGMDSGFRPGMGNRGGAGFNGMGGNPNYPSPPPWNNGFQGGQGNGGFPGGFGGLGGRQRNPGGASPSNP